jgi:hypothetical protein
MELRPGFSSRILIATALKIFIIIIMILVLKCRPIKIVVEIYILSLMLPHLKVLLLCLLLGYMMIRGHV